VFELNTLGGEYDAESGWMAGLIAGLTAGINGRTKAGIEIHVPGSFSLRQDK
jgi:hypothetical protein